MTGQELSNTCLFISKKVVLLIIIAGAFPILLSACSERQSESDIKIVAHRGAMSERPENTMSAFQRAVELGADIMEIDLRTSKDGQLFILHDDQWYCRRIG